MTEIRHLRGLDLWTIIAPGRRRRPHDVDRKAGPERCPFCPGNEHLLAPIVWEMPRGQAPGWQCRVVFNKYAALTPDASGEAQSDGLCEQRPGRGRHEVIIEHPEHDRDLAVMSEPDRRAVLETCRARYRALLAEPATEAVVLFRNHGGRAGASLSHPHSQIVSLPIIPPLVRQRVASAASYHEQTTRCVWCDLLAEEARKVERIVAANDHFIAFVPCAAIGPCEVWILPRAHRADFADLADAELSDLAAILGTVLRAYRQRLDDPQYNYVVHGAPRGQGEAPHLHWYLQLLPRLATPAGFELGAGMAFNPSRPEDDARALAATIAEIG